MAGAGVDIADKESTPDGLSFLQTCTSQVRSHSGGLAKPLEIVGQKPRGSNQKTDCTGVIVRTSAYAEATALWYPTIAPPDNWLIPAILYQDRVSTIVPSPGSDGWGDRYRNPHVRTDLARVDELAEVMGDLYVPTQLSSVAGHGVRSGAAAKRIYRNVQAELEFLSQSEDAFTAEWAIATLEATRHRLGAGVLLQGDDHFHKTGWDEPLGISGLPWRVVQDDVLQRLTSEVSESSSEERVRWDFILLHKLSPRLRHFLVETLGFQDDGEGDRFSVALYAPAPICDEVFSALALSHCLQLGWVPMSGQAQSNSLLSPAPGSIDILGDTEEFVVRAQALLPTPPPDTPLSEVVRFRREHAEDLATMREALRQMTREVNALGIHAVSDVSSRVQQMLDKPREAVEKALAARDECVHRQVNVVLSDFSSLVKTAMSGVAGLGTSAAGDVGADIYNHISITPEGVLDSVTNPGSLSVGLVSAAGYAGWRYWRAARSRKSVREMGFGYFYEMRTTLG